MRKRMLKTALSTIGFAALLLGNSSVFASPFANSHSIHKHLIAQSFQNTPEKAGDIKNGRFMTGSVDVSAVQLTNDSLSLSGSVGNTPFSLSGKLYQGVVAGRVNGILTDATGNFDVVRFELSNDPAHGIFKNRGLAGEVVALYLQKKGTRDLTILEQPAADVLGDVAHTIFSLASSYENAPIEAVLWFEKYFKADKTEKKKSPGVTRIISKTHALAGTNGGISPMSVTKVDHYVSYYTYYYIFGYNVNDMMELQEEISQPSDPSENVIADLKVYHTDFDEDTGVDLVDGVTGWQVGGNGPFGIKLNVATPQGIAWSYVAGTVAQGSTVNFQMSFSPSYYFLTANLTYDPPTTVQLGAGNQYLGGAGVADFYSNSGTYMNQVGQHLAVNWDTAYYPDKGDPDNVTDTVSFIYNMYNQLEGYDEGQQWDWWQFTQYVS